MTSKGEVLPAIVANPLPLLTEGDRAIKNLTKLVDVQHEMRRVYRFARAGKISDQEMARYVYVLRELMNAQKVQKEIELMDRGGAVLPFIGIQIIINQENAPARGKANGRESSNGQES